jgi:glycerophosphoryl diester phosphodiesterase
MFSKVSAGLLGFGLAVLLAVGVATPAGAAQSYASRVIGHRGGPASSSLPGNTLQALDWLADRGHVLEGDLRMTRDRQFVLFHNGKVGDTCEGATDNRIDRMTLAEVQRMRCYGGSYQLASLAQLLSFLKARPSATMYLESKHVFRQPHRAAVRQNKAIARQVRAAGLGGRVVLQDFRSDVLSVFNKVMPRVRTVYLDDRPSVADVNKARRLGADIYSYDIQYLAPDVNSYARSAGLAVNIWTIRAVAGAQRAFDAGADTISTDDPVGITAELDNPPEQTPPKG